jgi:hypothetical protein
MKTMIAAILTTGLTLVGLNLSQSAMAQTTPSDSAHTLVTPPPDLARPGPVETMPNGGTGVVTGGTSHYQTLQTPGGGSALAVPNGTQSSTVIGPNGRAGTATAPR